MPGAIAAIAFRHSNCAPSPESRPALLLPGGVNLCPGRRGPRRCPAQSPAPARSRAPHRRIVPHRDESGQAPGGSPAAWVPAPPPARTPQRKIRAPLIGVSTCERLRQTGGVRIHRSHALERPLGLLQVRLAQAIDVFVVGGRGRHEPLVLCDEAVRCRRCVRTRRRAAGGRPPHRASGGRPASIPQWPLSGRPSVSSDVPASNRAGPKDGSSREAARNSASASALRPRCCRMMPRL